LLIKGEATACVVAFFNAFENPWLCQGFRKAFSVVSKTPLENDKIKLVSRPLYLTIKGGASYEG